MLSLLGLAVRRGVRLGISFGLARLDLATLIVVRRVKLTLALVIVLLASLDLTALVVVGRVELALALIVILLASFKFDFAALLDLATFIVVGRVKLTLALIVVLLAGLEGRCVIMGLTRLNQRSRCNVAFTAGLDS